MHFSTFTICIVEKQAIIPVHRPNLEGGGHFEDNLEDLDIIFMEL